MAGIRRPRKRYGPVQGPARSCKPVVRDNHRRDESEWVYLPIQVIRRESDRAFQVVEQDGMINWYPKSQVKDWERLQAGMRDFVMGVTRWILDQKRDAAEEEP